MKVAVALMLALILAAQAIAKDKWIFVSETSDYSWSVKSGSFESTKTKGGKPISLVIGRNTNKVTTVIGLYKMYVSDDDCDAHMGKFVVLNLDGAFVFDTDFAFGSGAMASTMSELICAVRSDRMLEAEKKSI